VGAVWALGGTPRAVFEFTIVSGKIVAIDVLADPAQLQELDVQILDD
jgi:RNA polymerase sigma-70 factor (ECF subfamily)